MPVQSALLDVDRSGVPTWDRLPTPVNFDHNPSNSLLSPPLSRASSPSLSPLSISNPSTPADHPPLPSPVALPVGKKTSAFFAASFDPTPSPPRAASVLEQIADKRVEPKPLHSQTANSSFFFANGSTTPTPPPSIHSSADDGDASTPKRLPPLSRLFPSRTTVRQGPDIIHSPPSVRSFVTIEEPYSSYDSSFNSTTTPEGDIYPESPIQADDIQDTLNNLPISEEPPSIASTEPTTGSIVGTDIPLTLIRELGKGSFSCVWLAVDMNHSFEMHHGATRLRSQSFARKSGDRILQGLKPQMASGMSLSRSNSIFLVHRHGEGATAAEGDNPNYGTNNNKEQLVAIKMISRTLCEANDRTRISFVREVEVLRHISHPSIVSYLHSFTTPTHHCLVLEALLGGELFELLDEGDNHQRMTEPLLRRIFGELCQAVGWMHGVGLVHRDIKLENILLTANPFLASPIELTCWPSPLVKLTDFGLARFIDPASPTLSTRCGSESYAAPEIVTGKPYDGRQTDAWACGIVLYALVTRALPFDRPRGERDTRNAYLMRIANGEYTWPDPEVRLATDDLKSVVARLLVRDPSKRSRVVELWDEKWMRGEGAPMPPLSRMGSQSMPEETTGHLVGEDIPSVAKREL